MSAPIQNKQNAGWWRFKLGDWECTVTWDGYIHHGYEGIYPNADPAEMARLQKLYRLPSDHIPMDLNPVVVNTGENLILIDAGMGKKRPLFGEFMGRTEENMRAAGIDPADIDIVLMTHLHPDHSFGLINPDGSALYPNARLFCTQIDWDEWTDEKSLSRNDHYKEWTEGTLEAVAPYRERLELFQMGDQVLSGVRTMSVAGHSLGQVAYIFENSGEKVVFTGDVAHHHVYDPIHPEWFFHMDFDSDPELGAQAKSDIFRKVVDENIKFHGYHFPYPGLGVIADQGDGTYLFHPDLPTPRL